MTSRASLVQGEVKGERGRDAKIVLLGYTFSQEKGAMNTITITLPDERLQQLTEMAHRFKIAPEELVRASVEELLNRSEEDFRKAMRYVLRKNAELYRRLA